MKEIAPTCQHQRCGKPATKRMIWYEVPVSSNLCAEHAKDLDDALRALCCGVPAGAVVEI